jgi:hypothetical protein
MEDGVSGVDAAHPASITADTTDSVNTPVLTAFFIGAPYFKVIQGKVACIEKNYRQLCVKSALIFEDFL